MFLWMGENDHITFMCLSIFAYDIDGVDLFFSTMPMERYSL